MYAMFLSVPIHFGRNLCPDSTSNILIIASMGEGTVSGLFGVVIKAFGPSSLYMLTLLFAILMFTSLKMAVSTLERKEDLK